MSKLCVNFESWTVINNDYPPIEIGSKAELYITFQEVDYRISKNKSKYLRQKNYTEYSFCGEVIRVYDVKEWKLPLIIIDTGSYNILYWIKDKDTIPQEGQYIRGSGELGIVSGYPFWIYINLKSLPDFIYYFRVIKITGVILPEAQIENAEDNKKSNIITITYPSASDYDAHKLVDVNDLKKINSERIMYFLDLELV